MADPNYIQKMIDEYNAQNTQEIVNKKAKLEKEIVKVLNQLSTSADPVFKEFSNNPLSQKTHKELIEEIANFSNLANKTEQIAKPASMLTIHLNNYLIYKSFCNIENILRYKNIDLESTYAYQFLLTDLVDDVYAITNQMDISVKDLLTNCFYLALKDYLVTFALPNFKFLSTHRPKQHIFNNKKNNPVYLICETQKKFILQDELLSQLYKNFVYTYNLAAKNSNNARL